MFVRAEVHGNKEQLRNTITDLANVAALVEDQGDPELIRVFGESIDYLYDILEGDISE